MAKFNGSGSLAQDPAPKLNANLEVQTHAIVSNTAPAGGLHQLFWDANKLRLQASSVAAGATLDLLNAGTATFAINTPAGASQVNLTNTYAELYNSSAGGISRFRATGNIFDMDATGAVQVPNGTTAQAPAGVNGMIRYDDDTNKFRAYENGAWTDMIGGGGGGEANTSSNAGTGGIGITLAKSGVDLPFKSIYAASSKLSAVDGGANNRVELDVVEANLTLGNLGGTLSIAKGGTGQTTNTAAFDALAPASPAKGTMLVYNGTNWINIGVGSNDQVLTADSAEAAGVKWAAAGGGGGGGIETFQLSLPGNASSTIGQLSKANSSTGNPGGLKSSTSSGDPGINNGGPDPITVVKAGTINAAALTVAHAAVSTGTFTNPATARFDVYRVDYSTRTKLGEINFDITDADVFNNLGSNRFGHYTATPSISVAAGDLIGVEFVNVSGNDKINALGGIYLGFEVEET